MPISPTLCDGCGLQLIVLRVSADIAPLLYSRKLGKGLELRFKGLMSVLPPSIVFGTIEERRYSLEQLLEYAGRKFGKSLQDLQEINDRSWARRKARSLQQNNVVELPNTAEF
ncbi:hypothetical protein [Tolypothrix sp. NIES-4075]|uniref:hypothetical protein n=1 Tax=Tolypothrix sp. NIES-4075 TaxID=2005459 RepID=UPI000B5C7D69|nr:hypothetical protein [Tolypothrix sp. NIES-4075]